MIRSDHNFPQFQCEARNPFVNWALSQYIDRLSGYGIDIIEIRRSSDRLIFTMGIPIILRRHLCWDGPFSSSNANASARSWCTSGLQSPPPYIGPHGPGTRYFHFTPFPHWTLRMMYQKYISHCRCMLVHMGGRFGEFYVLFIDLKCCKICAFYSQAKKISIIMMMVTTTGSIIIIIMWYL